ncbi:Thymidylate kinase [hydrothermal vent metagenome]|uniref:dTMP kinase n=1 Tax=hydrothermal vent metagenome TaxID=652676 RepID=A0A3B1BZA2_9ZZZZ
MSKGGFITFEGTEGCGKSVQIWTLAEKLRSEGHDVILTREPGGTETGTDIRKILLRPETGHIDPVTELLLFSAARREIVTQIIAPAIKKGSIVLCDRFADSTVAYQGSARGMDLTLIDEMIRLACGDVWPDMTLILDLPVEEGLKRADKRIEGEGTCEARFEAESLAFHHKVREGFMKIAEKDPARVKLINAVGTIDEVHVRVYKAVCQRL